MAKDRARPFSRKHRRYWIPVLGGMVLIGVVNVIVGYCTYEPPPEQPPEQIELHVKHRPYEPNAELHLGDAGVPDR